MVWYCSICLINGYLHFILKIENEHFLCFFVWWKGEIKNKTKPKQTKMFKYQNGAFTRGPKAFSIVESI